MTDNRPWDQAELLANLLDEHVFIEHDRTLATGTSGIAVDFTIVPARFYEEERTIASAMALGETGNVKTIDVRFPKVTKGGDGVADTDMLHSAAESGLRSSQFPRDTNIVIEGSPGNHYVHYKFPHGDDMHDMQMTGFGSSDIRPRTAARSLDTALEAYHNYLDARIGREV